MTFFPPDRKPPQRLPSIWILLVAGVVLYSICFLLLDLMTQATSLNNELDLLRSGYSREQTRDAQRATLIQPTLVAQVIQQITASAPTLTPTLTSTPTLTPTNTPIPLPPSTTQVELMATITGVANFTVSLKPASVLNQSNDTPVSPREGSQAVYSRCYSSEFNQTPPVDEAKAIPFELVFSGQGLTTEIQVVTITLTTQGNFVAVKRGIDGSCVEATQHTDSGTIALGVSAGVTSQQATVYYLVPDDTTTITTPPIFTVTATLQDGTVLAPVASASNQLRVLPLMYFADTASIRSEKSRDMNAIIRPINAKQRVRVVAIEGEGADQWAQVQFDARGRIVEHIGYIHIGHQDVEETFIGLAEWVK